MSKTLLTRIFLFVLLIAVLAACFLIFRPFLIQILIAAILVSLFYTPYRWLAKKLGGREKTAALITCVLVLLVIIIPLTNLIIFAAQESVAAYSDTINFLNRDNGAVQIKIFEKIQTSLNINSESLKTLVVDFAQKASNWLVSGATGFLKGTTTFVISLVLIIFTMFFFFVDGKKMLERAMYWTPLPDKYDRMIFQKFRDVSYSVFVSTFAVALAQSALGAVAFAIVGLPIFLPAIAIALLSMIPYFGAYLIWLPAGIYLLAIGHLWQGIFLLIFGATVISTVDNLIRMYMIKTKAQVHPIFVLFSVLGGISLFGFWGVIIGPLVIALTVTILHIYDEVEYKKVKEDQQV
jgi:predicted PurR-regulated permease PerM